MRHQEKGKAYGKISAKALAVLTALLWRFHNAEAIAEAAGCARSTVYEAIRALEQVGVLSWVNRIKRVREHVPGLFGKPVQRRCAEPGRRQRSQPGAVRRQGGECGKGQIKPREPRRPQPDATTLRGSTSFAV